MSLPALLLTLRNPLRHKIYCIMHLVAVGVTEVLQDMAVWIPSVK